MQTLQTLRTMQILDKCFLPGHSCQKVLNCQTIKISYRTVPDLGHIIAAHNSKVIGKGDANKPTKTCSCPKKDKPNCPLGGQRISSTRQRSKHSLPRGRCWRRRRRGTPRSKMCKPTRVGPSPTGS